MARPRKINQIDTRALILSFGVGAMVFLLGWVISSRDLWGLLMPNAGDITFGDLNIVTTTAGCLSDPTGLDVRGDLCSNWALDPNSYPPEPYNYPSFWYKSLSALGVSSASTSWMGISLILLFALSVAGLAFLTLKRRSGSLVTSVIVLFLSLTPPSILAMERGNTDLIAFFLIVGSIFALQLPRNWAAPSLLALASIFKLFPIGAAVALLDAKNNRIRGIVIFSVFVMGGVSTYLSELSNIAERTPQTISVSFGSSVLPQTLSLYLTGEGLDSLLARFIGLLVFLVLGLLLLALLNGKSGRFSRSSLPSQWLRLVLDLRTDSTARGMFLIGSGAFCFTYLLGANFDYRAIFLLPVLFALLRLPRVKSAAPWLLILLSISLLLANSGSGYSTIGDLILLLVAPALTIAVAQLVLPLGTFSNKK
jgi:hypothetical protein